jgi:hypothetical protein
MNGDDATATRQTVRRWGFLLERRFFRYRVKAHWTEISRLRRRGEKQKLRRRVV